MRCAECRFSEAIEEPYHFQTHDRPISGYLHCTRWHEGYGVRLTEVAKNEAWVEDDEGWGNVVGPDFGCVLFEPRLTMQP